MIDIIKLKLGHIENNTKSFSVFELKEIPSEQDFCSNIEITQTETTTILNYKYHNLVNIEDIQGVKNLNELFKEDKFYLINGKKSCSFRDINSFLGYSNRYIKDVKNILNYKELLNCVVEKPIRSGFFRKVVGTNYIVPKEFKLVPAEIKIEIKTLKIIYSKNCCFKVSLSKD